MTADSNSQTPLYKRKKCSGETIFHCFMKVKFLLTDKVSQKGFIVFDRVMSIIFEISIMHFLGKPKSRCLHGSHGICDGASFVTHVVITKPSGYEVTFQNHYTTIM